MKTVLCILLVLTIFIATSEAGLCNWICRKICSTANHCETLCTLLCTDPVSVKTYRFPEA
ncbi:hypothetical protein X975_15302, partial [Stegodyphus mimosarum]